MKKKEIVPASVKPVAAPAETTVAELAKSSVVENTTPTETKRGAVDFKMQPRESGVVEKTSQPEQVIAPVVETTTPIEPQKPEAEKVQERRIKIQH